MGGEDDALINHGVSSIRNAIRGVVCHALQGVPARRLMARVTKSFRVSKKEWQHIHVRMPHVPDIRSEAEIIQTLVQDACFFALRTPSFRI